MEPGWKRNGRESCNQGIYRVPGTVLYQPGHLLSFFMNTSTVLATFGEALQRLPFGKHPALRIRAGEEYRGYCFGTATARLLNIQALCHELAHAVEFGPEQFDIRAKPHGYGFRFPVRQLEVGGRLYNDPRTGECSAREAQTVAIQLHLQEALGRRYRKDRVVLSHVRSFDHLPDWIQYGGGGDNRRRHRRLASLATRFYEEWTKPEIFDRLEGWLDRTRERLALEGEPQYGMYQMAYWTPEKGVTVTK
jgi:hypothetical protein